MTSKNASIVLSISLILAGLLLTVLGFQGAFNFVSCPPGGYSCINVPTGSYLAIYVGALSVVIGTILLARTRMRSHR